MIHNKTKVVYSTLRGLGKGYDIIAQQGGTYSGKTFGVLVALALFMRRTKQTLKLRVIGQTREHLQDGAYEDFVNIIEEIGGVKKQQEQAKKFWIGNCTIKFLSVDKIGKAKGPKFDITFINECNYLAYPIARQLMLRTNICTILDWNPVGHFWYHNKIILDTQKKILYKRSTYKDNPAVPEKVARDIESLKITDPQLYRVYALGLTGTIKGLVFTKIAYVDNFPPHCKKLGYGLDFGFTNDPTCLVKIGELHGELYMQELIYQTGLTNPEIVKEMKALGVPKMAEIWADQAEPKSIKEINNLGYRRCKGAKKGKDSVNHGIQLLQQYKKNIVNPSLNAKKEASNYKWKENKDGEALNIPVDKFNHFWDASRYYGIMKLKLRWKRSGISSGNAPY